jgi:ribonucleotide reductase alpha subunit
MGEPIRFADGFDEFTYDEALAASTEYFSGDEMAAKTFVNKYALKRLVNGDYRYIEATPDAMHRRMAAELSRIESKYPNPLSCAEIYDLLKGFQHIVPQGSIMYGLGNPFTAVSLSNCVVAPSPKDSWCGISDSQKDIGNLFKRRCGVGISLDSLRPQGMPVNNSAGTTTGAHSFMETYSHTCETIGQNGRRGALMLTMSVKHPDIPQFIMKKQDKSKVTGANVSVMLSDEFMRAVQAEAEWTMQWPLDGEPKCVKTAPAKEIWDSIIHCAWSTAEPGIIFWDNYCKNLPAHEYPEFKSICVNPCITGGTLVAVADGRGYVSMAELAAEGQDVPVYCLDDDNTVTVRMMRNPHRTGTDAPLVKVTLDDGTTLRVTPNHEFRLQDGRYVAAKDLAQGDSLRRMSRCRRKLDGVVQSKSEYWFIMGGSRKVCSEHRLIAEFHSGSPVPEGYVVHHRDFNSLNNAPDNLVVMTATAHDAYHGENRRGDNNAMRRAVASWTDERRAAYSALQSDNTRAEANPRYCGATHDELKAHALLLTHVMGRRFSMDEWVEYAQAHGLPQMFSKWRVDHLGGMMGLSRWAAMEVGVEHVDADPRVVRTYMRLTGEGYDCEIIDGVCWIWKTCEVCGERFRVPHTKRSAGICSYACSARRLAHDTYRIERSCAGHVRRKERVREAQAAVYSDLKFRLGREPLQKEWQDAARAAGVSPEIARKSSPFRNLVALKEYASEYNHKVVSVEPCGNEDVYNGAVDEFHNYFIGGTEQIAVGNGDKTTYVNTRNCSEIALSAYDSCRLTSVNLTGYVLDPFTDDARFDWGLFEDHVAKAMRLMDDIVDAEIDALTRIMDAVDEDEERVLWGNLRQAAVQGRRTGLGTHGLADTLAMLRLRYDSNEALDTVDRIYKLFRDTAYETSVKLAKERGVFPAFDWEIEKGNVFIQRLPEALKGAIAKYGRRNISLLTMAPTGTVSILSRTSSGIEPIFNLHYTRWTKINAGDGQSRVDRVDNKGVAWTSHEVYHPAYERWLSAQAGKVDGPPDFFPTAGDIDPMMRVRMQGTIQNYIDHGISSCLAAGDSLVLTDKGLLDVAELAEGTPEGRFRGVDEVLRSYNADGVMALIDQTYNNGVADTLIISMQGGSDITCTPSHRLMTLTEDYQQVWKFAKDIREGDIIVGRIGLNLFNKDGCQKTLAQLVGTPFKYERKNNSKDVRIPTQMTTELARLLGYMCSYGIVCPNGISLCHQTNNVVEDFAALVDSVFGVEAVIHRPDTQRNGLVSVVVNSHEIRDFFRWIGITDRDHIAVPKVIRVSTSAAQRAFLKVATLDGYVSEKHVCVLTSVSKTYVKQVQQMLLNFGIDTCMVRSEEAEERVFPGSNACLTKPTWRLVLSAATGSMFLDRVGFADDSKMAEALTKFRRMARVEAAGEVPDNGLRARFRKEVLPHITSRVLYEMFHSLTMVSKYGKWLSRESLQEMVDLGLDVPEFLVDCTYVFRPVTGVGVGPMVQTYDLSVPDGRSYVANGVVSHNTINLPTDVTEEVVADIYMQAWAEGLKGVTVYRDGCRDGVLTNKQTGIQESFAPKRPKVLPCDIHHRQMDKKQWVILVGLLEGEPYEVFVGLAENITIPKRYKSGRIEKRPCVHPDTHEHISCYDLYCGEGDDELVIRNLADTLDDGDLGLVTRLTSMALRHGVPLPHIVKQYRRGDKDADLYSSTKVVARLFEKAYITDGTKAADKCPECGEKLTYAEGCVKCTSCGLVNKCS